MAKQARCSFPSLSPRRQRCAWRRRRERVRRPDAGAGCGSSRRRPRPPARRMPRAGWWGHHPLTWTDGRRLVGRRQRSRDSREQHILGPWWDGVASASIPPGVASRPAHGVASAPGTPVSNPTSASSHQHHSVYRCRSGTCAHVRMFFKAQILRRTWLSFAPHASPVAPRSGAGDAAPAAR